MNYPSAERRGINPLAIKMEWEMKIKQAQQVDKEKKSNFSHGEK